ncbi:MAG TPA: ABC transporter substrate-binding protein [Rhodanobacteraceae bacterium]|nr:ABC transporter substrate-binding protein [Rhodanobacteraceae bacterium]
MKEKPEMAGRDDAPVSPSRRKVLIGGVAAGAAMMLGGSPKLFAAPPSKEIRIGYISPRSGDLGAFNASDSYMLPLVRKALAKGLAIGGTTYRVSILDRDSQSSPSRASQLAKELIDKNNVNLILTTSTPETVNPVSDACEAAGVPSIGTDCPLDSFFFGRGGKLGKPSPFKWSFDFSFGVAQFVDGYLSQWPLLKTNKKVAVMYPNDADGMAFREHLAPVLRKNGYTVVDPGPYQDGTTDFSSQIALFNRENCQIFNEVGLPPDIQAFWRQAAQLHFLDKLVIAQFTKSGSFFNQIQALGALGPNICAETFWAPVFPYKSPLTGGTSQQLADGYEKATGHIWAEQQGATLALFEVGVAVLKAAHDPTSRAAIRDVIPNLDMITTLGRVNFKTGPYPNTATTPMIGAQWVKTPPGSKFPLDWVTIDNVGDRHVPVQRKLVPYNLRG